jgi:hypothetical protein
MSRRKRQSARNAEPTPEAEVQAWNANVAVGDEVDYVSYPGAAAQRYRTSTRAEVLSGHTAVVWLSGKSGCVCCSHCTPVSKTEAA